MNKTLKNIIILILIGVSVYSCKENLTDAPIGNQPPETHLFLFPDSSISQQKSRLQVHWWGDDPDGLIVGFYFMWEGLDTEWHFTTKNDSVFSLPIGTVDTNYTFKIVAADNSGNGKYDDEIIRNDINFGPEPFVDENGNGIYDPNELFFDIGAIDETPAEQEFPIKNSAPVVEWSELSTLPAESFPVMTFGWKATDLDGDESIVNIYLALNDTSEFVELNGNVRLVTLIIDDVNAVEPAFNIFVDGSANKKLETKLINLKLDANNIIYLKAKDISGAESEIIRLPDTTSNWFVKKPKGKLLIVDDYSSSDNIQSFYDGEFEKIRNGELLDNYDIIDLEKTDLPYQNITLLETIKLFDYIFWYSDASPSLEVINSVTQEYLQSGGKIAFSMTFQDSSNSFQFDLSTLQNFLPVDSLGQKKSLPFLLPGAKAVPETGFDGFPELKVETTIGFVRTYFPNQIAASPVYNLQSSQINGNIALITNTKNLFFIGLPLNQCNGNGNIADFLEQLFYVEFGFSL